MPDLKEFCTRLTDLLTYAVDSISAFIVGIITSPVFTWISVAAIVLFGVMLVTNKKVSDCSKFLRSVMSKARRWRPFGRNKVK